MRKSARIAELSICSPYSLGYEGCSINFGTARILVAKVKNKNCSMWCSCDIYSVLHIPWVFIMTSLMTSLFSKILTKDLGSKNNYF